MNIFKRRKAPTRKVEEEIVCNIERASGYKIERQTRDRIRDELYAARKLNGEVSPSYINNLIAVFKVAAVEKSLAEQDIAEAI